jgi:hypothetical protein
LIQYLTVFHPVKTFHLLVVAILGTRDFSCINAVQHRAIRFFMGLSKYPPNDAINGDMGWKPPCAKQWSCVLRHWDRCNVMFTQ